MTLYNFYYTEKWYWCDYIANKIYSHRYLSILSKKNYALGDKVVFQCKAFENVFVNTFRVVDMYYNPTIYDIKGKLYFTPFKSVRDMVLDLYDREGLNSRRGITSCYAYYIKDLYDTDKVDQCIVNKRGNTSNKTSVKLYTLQMSIDLMQ